MQPGLYQLIHIKLILIRIGFSKYIFATCQKFSNGKHKLSPAHQRIITISSPKESLFRTTQSNKAGALQQQQDLSPHFTDSKPGPDHPSPFLHPLIQLKCLEKFHWFWSLANPPFHFWLFSSTTQPVWPRKNSKELAGSTFPITELSFAISSQHSISLLCQQRRHNTHSMRSALAQGE